MLDSRQLLEKGHLFGNELGGGSKEKASASVGFVAGYELCKKEYEEKFRWIPVEERLPETYSIVLATIKSPECIWVEEIGFGEGRFQLPGRGDTDFVTHWMYVPEPPSFL